LQHGLETIQSMDDVAKLTSADGVNKRWLSSTISIFNRLQLTRIRIHKITENAVFARFWNADSWSCKIGFLSIFSIVQLEHPHYFRVVSECAMRPESDTCCQVNQHPKQIYCLVAQMVLSFSG